MNFDFTHDSSLIIIRFMRKIILLPAMLLLAWGMASAQTNTFTLDSCKAMALRNHAKVRTAMLEVDAAKATRQAALTHYFPTLSVAAGAFSSRDYLLEVNNRDVQESDNARFQVDAAVDGNGLSVSDLQQRLDERGIDINLEQEINNLLSHVSVDAQLQMFNHGMFANAVATQPIFAGGRIVNGNKLASLGVEVAELQLLMTRDEVEMNVEESYWTVVALQEKRKTVEMLQQLLDTLERDAEAAHQAGVIGKNDLLKVRLKKGELNAARLQLGNGIVLATRALCQLVGMEYGSGMVLDNRLEQLVQNSSPRLTVADCASAVDARKESRLLEMAVQAEQLKHHMVVGEALPQVAVGATYGVNNLLGRPSDNAILFATVNVPLSAWWETSCNARKQNLLRREAEINRDDLRQKMELQTQQAIFAQAEALELAKIRRQAVADAEENLAESRNYYDAGMIGVSEYLETQTLLRQAQNEYVDQLVSARMAMVRCRQLTGVAD